MYKPSHTLNIKPNFFGLTLDDLLFLSITYSLLQVLFLSLGLEILAIFFVFLIALFLIPIRLKFRRGIIRDYLKFKIHCLINGNFYE